MNALEELLQAYKHASRAVLAATTLVVAVSVYLVQRNVSPLLEPDQSARLLNLAQAQAILHQLEFSFLTMSIVWPLVLGVLCTAADHLGARRHRIAKELTARDAAAGSLLPLIDLFDHTSDQTRAFRLFRGLVHWLPFTALATYLLSFLTIYLRDGESLARRFGATTLGILIALQALSLIAGFILCERFDGGDARPESKTDQASAPATAT
jgi:hypothetical protein